MNKYLFLLAWAHGSDSACGEETNVHLQDDLLPQFLAGNKHVFAVCIIFPCLHDMDAEVLVPEDHMEELAYAVGCRDAFRNNYTSHDSTSTCIKWEDRFANGITEVIVRDMR